MLRDGRALGSSDFWLVRLETVLGTVGREAVKMENYSSFFFSQFDKYLLSVCCVQDSELEFWEVGQRSETLSVEETLEEFGSLLFLIMRDHLIKQLVCARHCTRCLIQINPHGNSKRLILL